VFFVTAFSFSFLVIWEGHQNNQSSSNKCSSFASSTSTGSTLAGTELKDFSPVSNVPILKISNQKIGTGSVVTPTSTVTVDYTGAIASSGCIFQSSLDTGKPVTFALNQVIEGWKLGMVGMKVGGERELLIPAGLAYGASPPAGSNIPANANLVFDITLHSVSS
jgi:FKBP-type peptidyl-prolyl cis-trans isomerase